MNMSYVLKMIIALLISTVVISIIMNFNNFRRIDFVGFFEDLLKKIKK